MEFDELPPLEEFNVEFPPEFAGESFHPDSQGFSQENLDFQEHSNLEEHFNPEEIQDNQSNQGFRSFLDRPEFSEDEPSAMQPDPIVKKRRKVAPRPKLDADRLLGGKGFTVLRHQAPNIRFTGTNTEKLRSFLQCHQNWAHNLFPKFRFDDAVSKIEDICHEKRMRTTLRTWREEYD